MKTKMIVSATAVALLNGCANVPVPVVPDGSTRTPVNSDAKISEYKARVAAVEAEERERTQLQRQVDTLNRQVAELKLYMAALASQDGPHVRPLAPLGAQRTKLETESIEVREQSIVFRLSHGYAKTSFEPSDKFKEALVAAARSGKRIEIRGRTDSDKGTEVNRRIAIERATQARLFLVKNGIHPSKVHISALASGGFVTDNSTAAGKARNRRVEIEAMDLDAKSVQTKVAALNQTVQVQHD